MDTPLGRGGRGVYLVRAFEGFKEVSRSSGEFWQIGFRNLPFGDVAFERLRV